MGTFRPWSVEKGTDWDDYIAKGVVVVSGRRLSGRLRLHNISRKIFSNRRGIEQFNSPEIRSIDQLAGRRRAPGGSSPGQANQYRRIEPGRQTGPGFFFRPQPLEELHRLTDVPLEESLATARQFYDIGFLHTADSPEPTTPIHRPDHLIAWLHLTDRCNLRCSYCYLPHLPVNMPVKTGQKIAKTLFQTAERYQFSQVQIKYSGGEPLLRFPALLEIHQTAARLAREAQIKLDTVVLSNGTLLNSTAIKSMVEYNLRLMISMDCLDAAACQQRVYPDGRSSALDVKRAIELACQLGLVPHISVTVTGRNCTIVPEFVEWLLANDLPFNLNFYRENDLSASQCDLSLEENEVIDALMAAMAAIRAYLPPRKLLSSLIDRSDLASPHSYPCGVGQNYLVFTPSGEIAKCHMTLFAPVVKHQDNDPLRLIRADQANLQNPPVDQKSGCQDCEWRYACAGGCPLLTYRQTGSYHRPSPNCAIYRTIYPEALRLEGLRLLKYGSDIPQD